MNIYILYTFLFNNDIKALFKSTDSNAWDNRNLGEKSHVSKDILCHIYMYEIRSTL